MGFVVIWRSGRCSLSYRQAIVPGRHEPASAKALSNPIMGLSPISGAVVMFSAASGLGCRGERPTPYHAISGGAGNVYRHSACPPPKLIAASLGAAQLTTWDS